MTASAPPLTAETIVSAYAQGAFPMANPDDGTIGWYSPDPRAILPIDDPPGQPRGMHVSRSLAKRLRADRLHVTFNHDFAGVIRSCATPGPGREQTWIDARIIHVFEQLHAMGLAHSVEAYAPHPPPLSPAFLNPHLDLNPDLDPDPASDSHPNPGLDLDLASCPSSPILPPTRDTDNAFRPRALSDKPKLVGGAYGLALGGAFFGESMFSRETDASKVCLYHLTDRLHAAGFTLLDVQFQNDHIQQFGVREITRTAYLKKLTAALAITPTINPFTPR